MVFTNTIVLRWQVGLKLLWPITTAFRLWVRQRELCRPQRENRNKPKLARVRLTRGARKGLTA
jgi:hypothetical protein